MKLNHKIFGEGDPVIILHGLFGMLDNWQTIAKKLAVEYMVILVDQRDHGRSPHTEDFNYPLLADDLKVFMDENWIHQASIIGHSMGGKTAMQFALHYPEMVDKLIVVDMAPIEYEPGHNEIFEALRSIDLSQLTERKSAVHMLEQRLDSSEVIQFLLKNLSRTKEGSYRWKMNLDLIIDNYDSILAEITGDHAFDKDSLFIKGEHSDYILAEHMPQILALFPSSKLAEIKDAGHWIHADKPEQLLAEIQTFLN